MVMTLLLVDTVNADAFSKRYLAFYLGQYSDSSLVEEILPLRQVVLEDAYLATVAMGQVVSQPNQRRRWEFEAQVGKWFGRQTNAELNVAVNHRWLSPPWDRWVDTSFAIGNGISLATHIPKLEAELEQDGSTRLLYYLSLEATFRLPRQERWSLLFRIHHRSGVFGTFNGVDGGSNTLAIGLRYEFD